MQTHVSLKERFRSSFERERQRRRQCEDRRDWSYVATSPRHLAATKLEEAGNKFSPRAPGGSVVLLTA